MGLALVFVWDSVQREGFFKGFLLVLVKLSFWQGGLGAGYHSMGFRQFPDILNFFKLFKFS